MRVVFLLILLLTGCSSVFHKARLMSTKTGIVESISSTDIIQNRQWIPKETENGWIHWKKLIKLPVSYPDEKKCVKELKQNFPYEIDLVRAELLFKWCMEDNGWRLYETEFAIRPV